MTLAEELERVAAGSGADAVLAAEAHPGDRVYLLAFEAEGGRAWLAVDEAGEPVADRRRVREAVSILALCELAEDVAGGGDLDDLLAQLAALRVTENPPGLDEAEEAARRLQQVLGAPPALATPARLDAIGVAARELELALGAASQGSPFAAAMRSATDVVESLWNDVERAYRIELG